MKKNTFKVILTATLLLVSLGLFAQNSSQTWSTITTNDVASKVKQDRNAIPSNFSLYSLNRAQLETTLLAAPDRRSQSTSNVILQLPTENGVQSFRIFRADVLSDGLSEKFPNIHAYAGQGIDDPTAVARFSYSAIGIDVMITSSSHSTYYIEPYTKDGFAYIAYARADVSQYENDFICHVEDTLPANFADANEDIAQRNADDGMLRTFRLALACTGEYSQYHINQQGIPGGATDEVKKAGVLMAMNTAMTRVSGVFERDLGLTMVIVDDNDLIIFLESGTDPYTNSSGSAMLGQNQTTCDGVIGSANYDIGHVFSTGGGGIAQLRSPCTSNKARGVTGLPQPINDGFYIDFVSHEMGHQFGGNHTQNNNCQRSNASYEPGSASTIMGYAGICPPNVQNFSDDYFHAISIQEMWSNISGGTGSSCPTLSDTGNMAPTADAGPNYTIPASTPFILTGVGTDPDAGDALTYCWEQFDNQVAPMPPQATSTVGPMFRSLDPMNTPERFMPSLATVINGNLGNTWERLPSVTRLLRFRLTVRDNVAGGANSASDNMFINVNDDAGPFAVTSQNTPGIIYSTGSTREVTWDVANTDAAPVNTASVNILLSVDGGNTFDILLAGDTPNDGTEEILIPEVALTTLARIKVEAVDNIYYQMNGENFIIDPTLAADEFAFESFSLWPNPTDGTFNVSFVPENNAKIDIAIYDLRGRLIDQQSFENTSSIFSQAFEYSRLTSGMYFVKVSNGNKQLTSKLIKS